MITVEIGDVTYKDTSYEVMVKFTGEKQYDGDNPQVYWYINDLTITSLVSIHEPLPDVVHKRDTEPELFELIESHILESDRYMWYLTDRWEEYVGDYDGQ